MADGRGPGESNQRLDESGSVSSEQFLDADAFSTVSFGDVLGQICRKFFRRKPSPEATESLSEGPSTKEDPQSYTNQLPPVKFLGLFENMGEPVREGAIGLSEKEQARAAYIVETVISGLALGQAHSEDKAYAKFPRGGTGAEIVGMRTKITEQCVEIKPAAQYIHLYGGWSFKLESNEVVVHRPDDSYWSSMHDHPTGTPFDYRKLNHSTKPLAPEDHSIELGDLTEERWEPKVDEDNEFEDG